MSVIGYIVTCGRCEARMLLTAEGKHTKHCPDCLKEMLLEAIEEVITDHGDQDYPIGEVQG